MSEPTQDIAPGKSGSKGWALIKQRLISRRRELVQRVDAIGKDLERVTDPVSADWNERAAQRSNDEVLAAIGEADGREVAAIDVALRRLETGTYGSCTRCGGQISAARLRALPHVEYCERCALLRDSKHAPAG